MASAKHAVVIALLAWSLHTGCAHTTCSQNGAGTDDCSALPSDTSSLIQSRVGVDKMQMDPIAIDPATEIFSMVESEAGTFGAGGSAVQGVQAWLAGEDGKTLIVSFDHAGHSHQYALFSENIYHDEAQIDAGNDSDKLHLDPIRTFRLRDDGKWASATLHEDGTVQGLFEWDGRLMEVTPVAQQDPTVATAMLQDYSGEAPAHLIRWVDELYPSDGPVFVEQEKPSLPPGENSDVPVAPANSHPAPIVGNSAAWGGVKWFPGCYSGDSQKHEFLVSLTSDKKALDYTGGSTAQMKAKMDSMLNDASMVYEKQLNIQLKMGHMKIGTTDAEFGDCSASGDVMYAKLDKILKLTQTGTVPKKGANHLFTGCGGRWGILGIAYVGTICNTGGYNTGANKIHGGSSPWLTFAHELGHNFNGKHSFEDGQGRTGGVMDYGDGKLNGHYQFNTKYRKTEMCSRMNQKVNNCNGNFQAASTTPTGAPTVAPTAAPTTVPPGGTLACGFESASKPYCGTWEDKTGDKFDWTRKSGSTPSYGTGPSSAEEGSQYLFIETSSPRQNGDKAVLGTNKPIPLKAGAFLAFDYHMYGSSMGSLKVFADSDEVFSKSGNQGNTWVAANIPLDTYAGQSVTITFVGTRGSSWQGDAAIDDIVLFPGSGGASPTTTTMAPTTQTPEPEPEPTTAAPTTMPPTTVAPTVAPTSPPTTMAPTTMTPEPEPEPEPTTAPPGGGGSLEKRVDDLLKKIDSLLKLLTDYANKTR